MGYNSKIRIGTTLEGLEFLKGYVKERLGDNYLNSYMNNYEIFAKRDDVIFIGWDWVNFYEERPDVDAIYKGLRIMEDQEIPYRMGKVGEDYAEYGAIEIIDMDPFDVIPHIYTDINFIFNFNDAITMYDGLLKLEDGIISVLDKELESSIAFVADIDSFVGAYKESPEYFSEEMIISLHHFLTKKGVELKEADSIVTVDGNSPKEEVISAVAKYIRSSFL